MKISMFGRLTFVAAMITSCGSAQFFGSGSGTHESSAPSSPSNPSNGGTTNPNGSPTPGGSTGTSTGTSGVPGGPGVPGAPGYEPFPGGANYPGGVPGSPNGGNPTNGGSTNCNGNPCAPGQTPTWGPSTEVQTTPNTVIFGKDRAFHIGNGQFSASTCKAEISTLPLSGKIYFFQFEVTADQTSVNVNINKACGIDYSSGTVQLATGASELGSQPLAAGSSSVTLAPVTLNRGVYTVYVYAGKGDGQIGATWDIDDFVIGHVQIQGSQAIRAGRYGTYQ